MFLNKSLVRIYSEEAFIETEFSSRTTARNTLVFRDYYYDFELLKVNGNDNRATTVAARKNLVAESLECFLPEKPASDMFTCDKHLLSGVNLRTSFRRYTNNFTIISQSNKHYRVKIVEAKK